MGYVVYVFPTRRNLHRLLARLNNKGVDYKTFPDDLEGGWIRLKWRNHNRMKRIWCVIVHANSNPYDLVYELRQFGRVRLESIPSPHPENP